MYNLIRFLGFHARIRPTAEAIGYGDLRIRYADLLHRSLRLAGRMKNGERYLIITDVLPRNPSPKVLKSEIRRYL